jgi:diguanylate cyclase (GGDEF)-like protein
MGGMYVNRFYNAFKHRVILLSVAVLLAIFATIHIVVFTMAENVIIEQLGEVSQSAAVALSEYIMSDIGGYKEFLATRDVQSGYYRRMQAYFTAVKDASSIRFIYTERRIDEDPVEFILDAEPIGSADYSPPGSTTFLDGGARAVYATGLPAIIEPTQSDYGTLLGGCAPIFDADGTILGLTGVNIDATTMVASLNRIQAMLFTIYAFTVVLVIGVLSKYSGAILEPMLKDKLTGAYNKRYMEKLMSDEIKAAIKSGTELSLMMCDLDHFKAVNDTYGHKFGDEVLASVSGTIMGCLRKTDCFFRYGGEEFVVMLSKTDADTTLKIAERIRKSVEQTEIYNKDIDSHIGITISIGVSVLTFSQCLIETADKALYDAKKTRNSVSLYVGEEAQGAM